MSSFAYAQDYTADPLAPPAAAVPLVKVLPDQDVARILNNLEQLGIHRVGAFSVKAFRKEAARMRFEMIDGQPPQILSGARETAACLHGQFRAEMDRNYPPEALGALPEFKLHETLCAAGYNDTDGGISTALSTLSTMPDSAERRALILEYSKSFFRNQDSLHLGGSSVSGGGDAPMIELKRRVGQAIRGGDPGQRPATAAFLAQFAAISFEPLRNHPDSHVYIEYTQTTRANARGNHEAFRVLVDKDEWLRGEAAREALVHEIASKLIALIPAYPDQPLRDFVPSMCAASGRHISFPDSGDGNLRSIQDLRGGLALGCRPTAGLTSRGVMAPALGREQMPAEPQIDYFTCTLSIAGFESTFQPRTPTGQGSLFSTPFGVQPSDNGMATVRLDGYGHMSWTRLSFHDAAGRSVPASVLAAQNPEQASNALTLPGGETVTLNCAHEQRR